MIVVFGMVVLVLGIGVVLVVVVVVVVVVVGVIVPVLRTDLSCYMLEVDDVVGAFSNFQRGKAAAKLNWMNWIDFDSSNPMYWNVLCKCV